MSFTTPAANLVADFLAGEIASIGLCTAFPGSLANEISGGSPPYARRVPTFDAASGGDVVLANPLTFDRPAGTLAAAIGLASDGTTVLCTWERTGGPETTTVQTVERISALPFGVDV